ncbi:MAG: hypothetical protein ACREIV_08795 [Planctomycetaceae bacterium]
MSRNATNALNFYSDHRDWLAKLIHRGREAQDKRLRIHGDCHAVDEALNILEALEDHIRTANLRRHELDDIFP